MSESFTNSYARLFEIRLLHHYWLDEGATLFDLMPTQERRARLASYDMRPFLAITPTASTAATLAGLRCVYRETALGFVAAAPEDTAVPLDTTFEFAVTVKDAAFYNYTALTLRPRKIYEIFYPPGKRTYRYKENVPLLSNLTGGTRLTAQGKALFLSRETPALAADDLVESLVVSGNVLSQLTSDQPGADLLQLSADAATAPLFVSQADVPAIVPPPGLSGAPARGIELSDALPDDLFALLRLSAVRQDDADFSLVGSDGRAKPVHPVFQVRIKNRSSIWRYLHSSTGAVDAQEPSPLPLTRFGNAGTRQKPGAGLIKAERAGARITDIVSEIFI